MRIRRWVMVALVAGVPVVTGGVGFASADGVEIEETEPGLFQGGPTPDDVNLLGLIEEFKASRQRARSSPGAAEGRAESAWAFRNLGRSGAEHLFLSEFGDLVEPSVKDVAEPVADADDVVSVDDDNTAVIDPSGPAKRSLVLSTLPLQSPGGQPIDTGLEANGDSFEPAEPLTPVTLPREADGEILVGDDVAVAFAGVSASAPDGALAAASPEESEEDDLVFYPNAYLDTDLAVAALRDGFEIFTHLRSPRAPEGFSIDLDLPEGSSLSATEDGGAEIVSGDGSRSIAVLPPFAVDADGQDVPVSLELRGEGLRLAVSHRQEDFRYPILVDPVFDTWDWHGQTYATNWTVFPGWGPYNPGTTAGNYQISTECVSALPNNCNASGTGTGQGLHVRALPGHTYPASSLGIWRYFANGADSYISTATVGPYRYYNNLGGANLPMGHWGLRRSVTTGLTAWASRSTSSTGSGIVLNGEHPNPAERAKVFETGLYAGVTKTVPSGTLNTVYNRTAGMTLELKDGGPPVLDPVDTSQVPTWVDDVPFQLLTHASDSGLGVQQIMAMTFLPDLMLPIEYWTDWRPPNGCTGGVRAICPASSPASTALTFDPSSLAEGHREVTVVAWDALGNYSNTRTFEIQVDHTGPSVQLSGSATDQENPGTELTIEAEDKTTGAGGATTGSGIKSVVVKMKSGSGSWDDVYSEAIPCTAADGSCPLEIKRTVNLPIARMIEPDVDMRVEVRDRVGILGKEGSEVPEWEPEPPPAVDTADAAGSSCGHWRMSKNKTRVIGSNCDDKILLTDAKYKDVVRVDGYGGDDVIVTNYGNQEVLGGDGNDTIVSGIHNDTLHGNAGNDILIGGTADDYLHGGAGNDILIGNHGFDTLLGEGGDDHLRGGQGGDFLGGGPGTDTVSFADTLTPGLDDDPVVSSLEFGGWTGFPHRSTEDRGVYVNLAASVKDHPAKPRPVARSGPPRLGGGTDILCSRGKLGKEWAPMKDPLCPGRDVERIEGSAFSDFIVGSSRTETLLGGSGNDLILGRGGADDIYGGYGSDGLDGAGSSHLDGGPGSDSCHDRVALDANPGCEASDEEIFPSPRGQGPIHIGLVHPDDAISDPTFEKPIFADVYLRGTDLDDNVGIAYSASAKQMKFTLNAAPAHGLSQSSFGVSGEDGGCSADPPAFPSIVCQHSGKKLGALVVSGGKGEDSFAIRESGNTSSFGDLNSISMTGGFGSDLLQGSRAVDLLVDGDNQGDAAGRETSIGGSGDDVIIENRGSDRVEGGNGNDLLMSTAVCNSDRVDGGAQSDNSQWVQIEGRSSGKFTGAYVNLTTGVIGSTHETGTVDNPGFPESNTCAPGKSGAVAGVERVEGSNASDFIRGDAHNNRILGRRGRDTMYGGVGGFDTIQANDGWIPSLHRDQISCESGGGKALVNRSRNRHKIIVDPWPGDCTKVKNLQDSIYGESEPKEDRGETPIEGSAQRFALDDAGEYEGESEDEGGVPGESSDEWESAPELAPGEPEPAVATTYLPLGEEEGSAAYDSLTDLEAAEFTPEDTWTGQEPGDGPELQVPGVDPSSTDAVRLDGVDDEIEIDSSPEEEVADPSRLSVEMAVQFDEAPGGEQHVYSTGGTHDGVHLFRDGDGFIVFESRRGQGVYRAVSHEPVADGEWHQLNGVLDGTRVAVSVDGEESRIDYWESVAPAIPGPGETSVGTSVGEGNTALTVDDVLEFDGAQTDRQILSSLTDRGIEGPEVIEVEPVVTADQDEDGITDPIDNCPADHNPDQEDLDQNGVGDACDPSPDTDGDGISDPTDNCPDIFNSEQEDDDEDGVGDLCAGLPEADAGE